MQCLRLVILLLISIFGLSTTASAEICCPNGWVQCIPGLATPCADACEKNGYPGVQGPAVACRRDNQNNPLAGGGTAGKGAGGGVDPIGFEGLKK
jgi:hypothetical protein